MRAPLPEQVTLGLRIHALPPQRVAPPSNRRSPLPPRQGSDGSPDSRGAAVAVSTTVRPRCAPTPERGRTGPPGSRATAQAGSTTERPRISCASARPDVALVTGRVCPTSRGRPNTGTRIGVRAAASSEVRLGAVTPRRPVSAVASCRVRVLGSGALVGLPACRGLKTTSAAPTQVRGPLGSIANQNSGSWKGNGTEHWLQPHPTASDDLAALTLPSFPSGPTRALGGDHSTK